MNTGIQITEIPKYKWQKYRNTNDRNTEIKITEINTTEIPKYRLQKYRNTNYRNTEIQITEIQITKVKKYKLQENRNTFINYGWVFKVILIQTHP